MDSLVRRGSTAITLIFFIIICSLFVLGCGSTTAPVSSRTPPPSQKISHHIVAQGDTLFAIAWRYELNVDALARANRLNRPYTIYSGQRLTLNTAQPWRVPTKTAKVAVAPTRESRAVVGKSAVPKSTAQPAGRVTVPKSHSLPAGKWRWQWPVKGTVKRHYDTNRVFKGLDIQSAKGRKVTAAAPGVVVYAGRGLRGYGQLLIVKHSDIYLSAYAHNRKMYVKEGQRVSAGQKISEVGGDPENSGRLYFEIRKNGRPVDPMRLLPRL